MEYQSHTLGGGGNNSTMREARSNTLPAGGYRSNNSNSGTDSPFRSRHHSSSNNPNFRHWGSSLSLNSPDGASVEDLRMRSRTLRPADRGGITPARDTPAYYSTTLPRKWLPTTGTIKRRDPSLKDYLAKPRYVSTLDCVKSAQRERRSASMSRRSSERQAPAPRNLRLGSFLDDPHYGNDGVLIPDSLRQYYLDTYLDTYDSDYLTNFGDNSLPAEQDDEGEDRGIM